MSKTATKKQGKVETLQGLNITPVADRVIVRRDSAEEMSPGGIVIPDAAKERPRFGTVVATGPGAWRPNPNAARDPLMTNVDLDRFPMQVKVGDRVIIGHYSGDQVEINDQEYVILRESEILAVVNEG